MGSIVHRSVPTNLKWFPNCSHAHALFQDRFKEVQGVQYTVHPLTKLSQELYLGLKVAASQDRTESFIKTIEGQVRCITAEYKLAWNVSYINVFIPAWMVPPAYHSLRREKIKSRHSKREMGIKSLRPTWFEDETAIKTTAEPMHGQRLIIKEDVLPSATTQNSKP